MKSWVLAASTILAWGYGIATMVVAFSGNAAERVLDRIYPGITVLLVAAIIAYVVDPLRNPRVPQDKRKLWAVLLALGHVFAQPFYWWWYLRRGDA